MHEIDLYMVDYGSSGIVFTLSIYAGESVSGMVRHVPTKVVLLVGKYCAQINSMTNSVYAVIWHPLEFSDVTNHRAKSIVDMGSRMISEGREGTVFGKDDDITRAEFAAILVRGLGLKPEIGTAPFPDVSVWARASVVNCLNAGIVSGRSSTELAPKTFMTRVEVTAIVSPKIHKCGGK